MEECTAPGMPTSPQERSGFVVQKPCVAFACVVQGPVFWEPAAWLFCTCASWLCFPGLVPQHACRESGAPGNCWASQACAGGLVMGGGQALLAGFDGNLRQTKYSWNTMVGREWGMDPSWTSADSLTVLDLAACCCLIRS